MPKVTLHTMDFECDCGTVAKNVLVTANLFCQDCGRRYALTLTLTREREEQCGTDPAERLAPLDPPPGEDGGMVDDFP